MNQYYFILFFFIQIILLTGVGLFLIWFWHRMKSGSADPVKMSEGQKTILPLRLQAYERILLLLERISAQNLILRVNEPGMSTLQLQAALVKTIREEFEYNLSQQLYLSEKSWELVRAAKEDMISLVNISAARVAADAPSTDLATLIIQASAGKEKSPVASAVEEVKKEVRDLF